MDSAGRPSTIRLKYTGRNEEARASVAVMPGHLIELHTDNTVKPHATAAGVAERAVATEISAALMGKGIDNQYAIGDLVTYGLCSPGDEMFMWLKDGETVLPGNKLVSNGDGTLKKQVAEVTGIVAVAREVLDLTGVGNTTAQRLKVRML